MKKILKRKKIEEAQEEVKTSGEELKKQEQVAMTIAALRDNGEFRYYLLNNLVNINENLKKLGQVLVEIGKSIEEESEEEEGEED